MASDRDDLTEMDKQLLRDQILAEEIARRRILLDGVRRELITGCSSRFSPFLGLESSRISDKLGFLEQTRSELLPKSPICAEIGLLCPEAPPFQRQPKLDASPSPNGVEPPLHHEKEIIMLPKPELNVGGVKRKAPSPETDDINMKKKPKEYYCVLCQVCTTSERGLDEHMKGKKHRARSGFLNQKKELGYTAVEITSHPDVTFDFCVDENSSESVQVESVEAEEQTDVQNKNNKADPKTVKWAKGAKSKDRFNFWCEICQTGTMSVKVMADHRAGKKHWAKLRAAASGSSPSKVAQSIKELGSQKSSDTTGSTCDPGLRGNKRVDGEVAIAETQNLKLPIKEVKDVDSGANGDWDKSKFVWEMRQAEEVSAIFMSAHEESSKNVHGEAAIAEKQDTKRDSNNKTDIVAVKEARDADLDENRDAAKLNVWPGLCQVGEVSAMFMSAHDGGMK